MFCRALQERPPLLLPPLHRLPLYPGDVLEIAGASLSAKSQILMQVAVNCILPKEWKDVQYGCLERAVMYFDLDCRFDILRLSQLLRSRIRDAKGSKIEDDDNNELIQMCLKRFLYVRCYDSFGFLDTLKYWSLLLGRSCFNIIASVCKEQVLCLVWSSETRNRLLRRILSWTNSITIVASLPNSRLK